MPILKPSLDILILSGTQTIAPTPHLSWQFSCLQDIYHELKKQSDEIEEQWAVVDSEPDPEEKRQLIAQLYILEEELEFQAGFYYLDKGDSPIATTRHIHLTSFPKTFLKSLFKNTELNFWREVCGGKGTLGNWEERRRCRSESKKSSMTCFVLHSYKCTRSHVANN
jgi:hypothetical protein